MKIRRDGSQNIVKFSPDVVFLHQRDANMNTVNSLSRFRGDAHVVSTKNFQLVVSTPLRQYAFQSSTRDLSAAAAAAEDSEEEGEDVRGPAAACDLAEEKCDAREETGAQLPLNAVQAEADAPPHEPEAPVETEVVPAFDHQSVFFQMGKVNDDEFICSFSSPPFTMFQAFMICLSRFETLQKY